MADFDPSTMTNEQMAHAAGVADLCGRCRHKDVCIVPRALAKRAEWHLSIATCAHYEKERTDGYGAPSTDGPTQA